MSLLQHKNFIFSIGILLLLSCKETNESQQLIPEPTAVEKEISTSPLSYDQILGALVGSAIGDAMGASTEMWNREDIYKTYGYISTLTPAIRVQSPEGTWDHNLPAGSSTDDTRWKLLMLNYFENFQPNPVNFSTFINGYYEKSLDLLKQKSYSSSIDAIEHPIEQIDWIKEWARVSRAYLKGPEEYMLAKDRFYGGEMSCAGMLYSSTLAMISNDAEEAYIKAYQHALFDQGYAKDISGLVSSLSFNSFRIQSSDSLLNSLYRIDPMRFQDSRLVGRIAQDILLNTQNNARDAKLQNLPLTKSSAYQSLINSFPKNYPHEIKDWHIQHQMYSFLDKNQRAIAFHAAEIWQILIASLAFADGDFNKGVEFAVNYGRDNDTVAAITGFVLGAQVGFERLDESLKQQVLDTHKNVLGIDLEAMAKRYVELLK